MTILKKKHSSPEATAGNDNISDAKEELFKLIGSKFFVGSTTVNSMLGGEVVVRDRLDNLKLSKPVAECVTFFNCRSRSFYDTRNSAYLSLPVDRRLPYTRMAFPSGTMPLKVDESEVAESESTVVFNYVQQALNAYSGLLSLQKAKGIVLGQKKLLRAQTLKSIVSKITKDDKRLNFLSYNLNDWPERVQALTFAGALVHNAGKLAEGKLSAVDVIRKCVEALPDILQRYGELMSLTLPHLIDLENAIMKYCLAREAVTAINDIMRESGGRGHIDVGQIKAKLVCDPRADLFQPVLFSNVVLHDSGNWVDYFAVYNYKLDVAVTPDIIYDHVGSPFVEGYLLMLAAMGCVEAVIEKPESKEGPAFIRGVRSVKLTKLGCYAFGLVESAAIEADTRFTVENEFELSDSRLIATMVVKQSPCALWMSKFGKKVGSRRFHVTEESALSDCESLDDLRRQIDFFKEHICPDPPQIWLDFFDSLIAKAESVQTDTTDYLVFKIQPDNQPIHKLITGNEEIRSHTLMAEDYRLLVPRNFSDRFREILRSNGFLVNL